MPRSRDTTFQPLTQGVPSLSDPAPWVSVVIPTLNSARTLGECLRSVVAQDYPRRRMEIVVADAGSTDGTLELAREAGVDRVVANDRRTGEAGKSAGIVASRGELLAMVDSDNVLDSPWWLRRMVRPFSDPAVMAAEPLWYTWRRQDPALTRYFALLGMNDPLCLFMGNYDRRCGVTGRWTGLPVQSVDRGDYLEVTLDADRMPTMGANGFVLRRSVLQVVQWQPYFFDIDVMHQAARAGLRRVAKVKCGIVHLYGERLADFARKQDRRVRDFLYHVRGGARRYPWRSGAGRGVFSFCAATGLGVPLLVQAVRGWMRQPDWAWGLHLPACWITAWVYGRAVLERAVGRPCGELSREGWQAEKRVGEASGRPRPPDGGVAA